MLRLTPVLAPTTGQEPSLAPRERVKNQSLSARDAVRRSSMESGLAITTLAKNEDDVPQPDGDVHWSLSHTTAFVAGVVAPCPVGIDIEGPRKLRPELKARVIRDDEADILGGRSDLNFLRAWTAKEAVLKCLGIGMAGLSRCRIVDAADAHGIHIEFDSQLYQVMQDFHSGHVAALCLLPSATPLAVEIDWIHP